MFGLFIRVLLDIMSEVLDRALGALSECLEVSGASLLIGHYVPVVWCRCGAVVQLWLLVVELHCWIVWKPSVLSLSDDGALFYLIGSIFQVQAQRWYFCVCIQLSITGFVLFMVSFFGGLLA